MAILSMSVDVPLIIVKIFNMNINIENVYNTLEVIT